MYQTAQDRLIRNLNKVFKNSGSVDITLAQANKQGLNLALAQYQKDLLTATQKLIKQVEKDMRDSYTDTYTGLSGGRKPVKRSKEILDIPWSGHTAKERISANVLAHIYRIRTMVEKQFRKTGNLLHVELVLRELFNSINDRQERLRQTEIRYARRRAEMDYFLKMGVKFVKYISEDDERVCDECRSLEENGTVHTSVYRIGDAPVLPRHPHCRCYYLPCDRTGKLINY